MQQHRSGSEDIIHRLEKIDEADNTTKTELYNVAYDMIKDGKASQDVLGSVLDTFPQLRTRYESVYGYANESEVGAFQDVNQRYAVEPYPRSVQPNIHQIDRMQGVTIVNNVGAVNSANGVEDEVVLGQLQEQEGRRMRSDFDQRYAWFANNITSKNHYAALPDDVKHALTISLITYSNVAKVDNIPNDQRKEYRIMQSEVDEFNRLITSMQ